jgi:hypothetical protein
MKNYIVGNFNNTGINMIDIDLVMCDWNHLWFISRWHDEYSLIKAYSKRSKELTKLKTRITQSQAFDLIDKLNLEECKSGIFNNASTFREV